MREIKFRRWRKFNDRVGFIMEHFNLNMREDNLECDLSFGEVMQYTGIKDVNRKEIYEGDVVKFRNKYISKVEYSNAQGFIIRFKQAGLYHCINIFSTDSEIEVIGNIYENEDLL